MKGCFSLVTILDSGTKDQIENVINLGQEQKALMEYGNNIFPMPRLKTHQQPASPGNLVYYRFWRTDPPQTDYSLIVVGGPIRCYWVFLPQSNYRESPDVYICQGLNLYLLSLHRYIQKIKFFYLTCHSRISNTSSEGSKLKPLLLSYQGCCTLWQTGLNCLCSWFSQEAVIDRKAF